MMQHLFPPFSPLYSFSLPFSSFQGTGRPLPSSCPWTGDPQGLPGWVWADVQLRTRERKQSRPRSPPPPPAEPRGGSVAPLKRRRRRDRPGAGAAAAGRRWGGLGRVLCHRGAAGGSASWQDGRSKAQPGTLPSFFRRGAPRLSFLV